MQRILIAGLAALLAIVSSNAQALQDHADVAMTTPASEAVSAQPAVRAIDAVDLSAYVDGVVQTRMRDDGIAGVVVAIVDGHGNLLLRGYGIASQQPRRAVDPERTLFRIGSISKTFSYLETLKLIDAGKLRLDVPVNDYLPPALKLSADRYAPVRLLNLVTHTAGFEDSAYGNLFVDSAAKVLPLDEYLVKHRPARVREPGMHAVYSNYSVALLGALLAHVEGMDFETLMDRAYFDPLGMRLSTYREPLTAKDPRNASPRFNGLWSQGFKREDGGYSPQPFEYIAQIAPAGGVSTTGADMARYLRMLLGRGELDGVRVLPQSAFDRLQGTPLFHNAPDGAGISYGFFRHRYGQVESLEHGGATLWFHSNLVIVPELGVGIFISTNTDTGGKFAYELPELVLERYFPQARAAALPVPPKNLDLQRFVGTYASERTASSTFEKLMLANGGTVDVAKDGTLVISTSGDASRWTPDGDLSFRKVEGQGRISFLADRAGHITGFASSYGENVWDRVGLLGNPNTLIGMWVASGAIALLVLVGAWLRRGQKSAMNPSARRAALWLYVTAVVWLVFLSVFGIALVQLLGDDTTVLYRYPGMPLRIGLWIGTFAIAMTALCVPGLVPAWRTRGWNVWRKLRHTGVVAIFASTCALMWIWNALGWKL
jgi:CubicO group peptidase (beta-lactamase class C family)